MLKKGDSLCSIRKKYPGMSILDLKKWNDIRGEEIKPGMKLKING
jgi:membrane-bound lytic murein transglycosylase D